MSNFAFLLSIPARDRQYKLSVFLLLRLIPYSLIDCVTDRIGKVPICTYVCYRANETGWSRYVATPFIIPGILGTSTCLPILSTMFYITARPYLFLVEVH